MDKDVYVAGVIENMGTLGVAGIVVIALATILKSFLCLAGLIILLNLNNVTVKGK